MKVRALVTLVAAAAIVIPARQAAAQVGIVGGLVSASLKYQTPHTGDKSLVGFAAGITVRKEIAKGFEFAPEALYIMKGQTFDFTGGTEKIKIAYGEIPVLFRVKFSASGQMHVFLTAGPTIAFKISCKIDETDLATRDCNASSLEPFKSTDFGAMFGAGISSGMFEISGRFEAGLADINHNAGTAGAETIKNQAILVMVGITF